MDDQLNQTASPTQDPVQPVDPMAGSNLDQNIPTAATPTVPVMDEPKPIMEESKVEANDTASMLSRIEGKLDKIILKLGA